MSWGFFCDVEVTLPTKDFDRIWKSKMSAHPLPKPLIGFRSKELERTFTLDTDHGDDDQPDLALRDLEKYVGLPQGRSTKTTANGETTFRATMLLDRGGNPHLARVAAALLHAARATGRGHLLLANDGSYSGEDGVLLLLEGGVVTRTLLGSSQAIRERLFASIYPAEAEAAGIPSGGPPTAEEIIGLAGGRRASGLENAAAKTSAANAPASRKR